MGERCALGEAEKKNPPKRAGLGWIRTGIYLQVN